jgi:hypothetical protein
MVNHLIKLTALASFILAIPAFAAAPKILHQAEAEEAKKIDIYIVPGGSGHALIEECERCPLKLEVDASTRFFYRNKPVAPADVSGVSGGAGTVIHDKGKVIRIRWDTDAAGNK